MSDKRPDPSTAERALNEARIRQSQRQLIESPKEIGGRLGLEPARFGDWENKGIAYDF
jgi:hypothetical protein